MIREKIFYFIASSVLNISPPRENTQIYQCIFIPPLCKVYLICCITLRFILAVIIAEYISISWKLTDLSMHFHPTVMQGIFDILHHFADLYCLQIPSIYLHLLKTYGFINSFSSNRYVRYTWSPASLCRSILSAKSLNISEYIYPCYPAWRADGG